MIYIDIRADDDGKAHYHLRFSCHLKSTSQSFVTFFMGYQWLLPSFIASNIDDVPVEHLFSFIYYCLPLYFTQSIYFHWRLSFILIAISFNSRFTAHIIRHIFILPSRHVVCQYSAAQPLATYGRTPTLSRDAFYGRPLQICFSSPRK